MQKQTSLNVATSECSKQQLVVPTSRKMQSSVAVEFQNYLLAKGFKESSANDYPWRISKICVAEKMTWDKLAQNINLILPKYSSTGEKHTLAKRSHFSYFHAIKHFALFIANNAETKKA